MDKDIFFNEINEIEVPRDEVVQSIKLGVSRAVNHTSPKKKRNSMSKAWISGTVAAGILITSSLIVPSFSKALADAPVIGGWYAGFNDIVGRNLEEQNLVKKLNQTYSSNGVDVALTSAYYDGYLIGITFDVQGDIKEDKDNNYYALYKLFNGDPNADETKELTTLKKTEEGFTGHIRIVYPYKDLPKSSTIPVSFEEIGTKKGNWQFNVPVQQNPVMEHVIENGETTNPDGKVVFKVDSVITGKASTAIIYRITYPRGALDKSIRMLNVDSDVPLSSGGMSDGIIEKRSSGDRTTIVRKLVLPQLFKNTTLKVSPAYNDTYSPVDPVEIEIP